MCLNNTSQSYWLKSVYKKNNQGYLFLIITYTKLNYTKLNSAFVHISALRHAFRSKSLCDELPQPIRA